MASVLALSAAVGGGFWCSLEFRIGSEGLVYSSNESIEWLIFIVFTGF